MGTNSNLKSSRSEEMQEDKGRDEMINWRMDTERDDILLDKYMKPFIQGKITEKERIKIPSPEIFR